MTGPRADGLVMMASYSPAVALILLLLGSNFGLPVALSVAIGGSMYPTIRSGDMNVLVSTSISPIEPGDIAVYARGGVFVVHRVERIEGGVVVLKGDNNVEADAPVPIEDVKYKVVATIPAPLWAPILSTVLVASAFTPQAYLRRRRRGEGYNLHTLAILAVFIALASAMSSSVFVDEGHKVKPVPAPEILSVTRVDGNRLVVKINIDPVSVECGKARCEKIAPRTIMVWAGGRSARIYARLPTVFNTTAVFLVSSS